MSTSNIEYLDSKVQQMNLATFCEEQISFNLDKSRATELESENSTLKLQMKTKEQSWNKDRAILTQKIELLESHIYESKIRQENLQKMNEAFMNTLNDLTANPKNFSNKMLKELQQLFENRLQMDPQVEQKLQKSALTIKQQQEEIEELKRQLSQYEEDIQLLKGQLLDNEKIIENSFQRQKQDLALISQEKSKECKNLESSNLKMKQMYEKDTLALQKSLSEALKQVSQLQKGSHFDDTEQKNSEIHRLNNIIDTMNQNHRIEVELIKQKCQIDLKMMENQKQSFLETDALSSNEQSIQHEMYQSKIQQVEGERNQINSQLQSVLSQLHQVSNQNSGFVTALQLKDSQIEELKNKMVQMQASMPQTCQDFFDVELQISRIEPDRSKRRSIVNESIISNLTPVNGNNMNNNINQQSLNMINNGFNAIAASDGFIYSNNTSSNGFAGVNSSNGIIGVNNSNYQNNNNTNNHPHHQNYNNNHHQNNNNNNNHHHLNNNNNNNREYQNSNGNIMNHKIEGQIPLLQNNYSSSSNDSSYPYQQGSGFSQSIQFNNLGGNQEQEGRVEQQKQSYNQQQQNGLMRKYSLANSELSNCDTFGNPSSVKDKRVISTTTSASIHNLANDFLNSEGMLQNQGFTINGQSFLRTDLSNQTQSSSSNNQLQQTMMDTSTEKKNYRAGQIIQKRKLQSIENIESQTSIHNLKTEDTVTRRERTTTTSASYHGPSSAISNSISVTNFQQLKNNGGNLLMNGMFPSKDIFLQPDLTGKALTLQQLQQQKLQKMSNLRNSSLNPSKIGNFSENNNHHLSNKTHQKNISLNTNINNINNNNNSNNNNSNVPLAVSDLKKSITDVQNSMIGSSNNINNSIAYHNNNNNNINNSMNNNINNNNMSSNNMQNNYNSNQSIISQSNVVGVSQSFMKNNPMTQSSLLNQEQSFLVRAIQENMQERLTLEEKMRNLESEVQNYININQQKTRSNSNTQSTFSTLVKQVMKELYSKQLNKSIFLLGKEERENVLKQEIKNLVDKIMIKPLQQRQQSQENKSMIINQSLNKSISMEDGILKDSKSPRYHQTGNLGVSSLLNSSSLSSSKGFLNFVNQNKENSSFNPKNQTGSLKSNSNILGRVQVKPSSTSSFQSQLQGLQGQNFFEKKINQLNVNSASTRNSRQII